MKLYRITKRKHLSTAWDGIGAEISGGRWNSKGRRATYTGSSRALSTLELAVHIGPDALSLPYVLFEIDVPDEQLMTLEEAALPSNWRTHPAPIETQDIGDQWLDSGASLGLIVPSVIIPQEYNVLLNPAHELYLEIAASAIEENYVIDPRIKE